MNNLGNVSNKMAHKYTHLNLSCYYTIDLTSCQVTSCECVELTTQFLFNRRRRILKLTET